MKNKRGITLIALVITIIVLLILAGVSISFLTGDNGILNKATIAKSSTDNANNKENSIIEDYNNKMNTYFVNDNYMIKYDTNGANENIDSQIKQKGINTTLSSIVPTKSGYIFQGWDTDFSADNVVYNCGTIYYSDLSTTLYAVWTNKVYLYNYGDTCDSITGGWTGFGTGSSTQIKKSNYLYLTSASGAYSIWSTVSNIDLSKYKTINYNCTFSSYSYIGFDILASNNSINGRTILLNTTSSSQKDGIFTYNINLSNGYPSFNCWGGTTAMCYEIWLGL